MEWLAEWIRNLAFYFIFLSAIMNLLPGGEEKKYIRFFMGMLLILLLLRPMLQWGDWEEKLEKEVLSDSLEEAFEEMMRETGRQELAGEAYVKHACEREVEHQLETFFSEYGYEIVKCEISFFDGDLLELEGISLTAKKTEKITDEKASVWEQEEFLKNKLEEVYNIPEGNINISIQG